MVSCVVGLCCDGCMRYDEIVEGHNEKFFEGTWALLWYPMRQNMKNGEGKQSTSLLTIFDDNNFDMTD